MGPAGLQHQQQQQHEQLLSSCLGLLDIRQAEGAKHVELSPDMFRKPNAKAFELVLYHAYCTIKGKAAARKNLRGLWPLLDKDRKQSKEFYQKIQEWLKESGQLADCSLAAFQRNPSGPKLVGFLCELAHWALEVQHTRMYADDAVDQVTVEDPALLTSLAEPLVTAAEAHNQLEVDRLLQLCQEGSQLQQQAEATAAQLKDLFYDLTAQLREAQAQQAAAEPAQPQAPSIKLGSILPAQLSFASSSSSSCGGGVAADAAAVVLPAELLQQQQEVHQLWQQLEQYVQEFEGLATMVQHLAGSAGHPYAIDAVQLRAYGQAAGFGDVATVPGAALDIAALVEAWLFDVGSVCRYVKTLAGYTANLEQQQDNQQRGWLPVRPGGIGRCSFMSPLVATSDAASHATHLYAQLSLHRACRDGLLGLQASLQQQEEETAVRMQAMQAALCPLFEQAVEQAHSSADYDALLAAGDTGEQGTGAATDCQAAGAAAAAAETAADAAQPAAATAAAAAAGWGNCAPGLFDGGHHQLQLIPPTPLLQKQVAQQQLRQQRKAPEQQQQQGSSLHLPLGLLTQQHPSAGARGSDDSDAGAGAAAAVTTASSSSPDALPPLQQQQSSSPWASPRRSSVSPGAVSADAEAVAQLDRPAAELLMSTELMDLDLVGPAGSDDELDDGGIFSTVAVHRHSVGQQQQQQPQHSAGGGGRCVGRADVSRISFARFSLGSDTLSPLLATAAAAAGGEQQQQQQVLPAVDEGSGAAEGDGEEEEHEAGAESLAGGQAATQDTVQDWGNDSESDTSAAAGAADNEACAVGGGSSAGPGSSPCTAVQQQQQQLLLDPGSASEECLSSAKPRRLTFAAAAAASVDSRGSAAFFAHAGGCASSVGAGGPDRSSFSMSTGSPEEAANEEEVVESSRGAGEGQQAGGGGNNNAALAMLRERMQRLQGGGGAGK